MPNDRFEVVFICTGNRFRSAIAEALLTRMTAGLPVRVSSAGTLDLGPVAVLPEAFELAPSLGVDLADHRARCVRAVDLTTSDLVLGFELVHVATAVVDCGARRAHTFTLPELAAVLPDGAASGDGQGDLVQQARDVVARAHEARTPERPLELADPLGGSADVFRYTAGEVRTLTEQLATALFGVRR
jgi:protein-tyrosine phosphatase